MCAGRREASRLGNALETRQKLLKELRMFKPGAVGRRFLRGQWAMVQSLNTMLSNGKGFD